MRPEGLIQRLLFLLPVLLALGIWAGHQTLASSLIEYHPDYPIKLSTVIAPVPDCPSPVIVAAPRAAIPVPVPLNDHLPREAPVVDSHESRGPPRA
jgi:hypothetical protein